jgi:hypothetical protein
LLQVGGTLMTCPYGVFGNHRSTFTVTVGVGSVSPATHYRVRLTRREAVRALLGRAVRLPARRAAPVTILPKGTTSVRIIAFGGGGTAGGSGGSGGGGGGGGSAGGDTLFVTCGTGGTGGSTTYPSSTPGSSGGPVGFGGPNQVMPGGAYVRLSTRPPGGGEWAEKPAEALPIRVTSGDTYTRVIPARWYADPYRAY